jgi:hypothetical protein
MVPDRPLRNRTVEAREPFREATYERSHL